MSSEQQFRGVVAVVTNLFGLIELSSLASALVEGTAEGLASISNSESVNAWDVTKRVLSITFSIMELIVPDRYASWQSAGLDVQKLIIDADWIASGICGVVPTTTTTTTSGPCPYQAPGSKLQP